MNNTQKGLIILAGIVGMIPIAYIYFGQDCNYANPEHPQDCESFKPIYSLIGLWPSIVLVGYTMIQYPKDFGLTKAQKGNGVNE